METRELTLFQIKSHFQAHFPRFLNQSSSLYQKYPTSMCILESAEGKFFPQICYMVYN